MRHIILMSSLVSILFGPPALAQGWQPHDWLEMSDLCEALVFDQDNTAFDGFDPAEPLVRVQGLREMAVTHPRASLIASAVSQDGNWFMCLVAAMPPLQLGEASSLIGFWAGIQYNLVNRPGNKAVVFDTPRTFAPVRVRCGADGQLAVIMAFLNDEGAFRIAVTNRLPSKMEPPCPAPGS